MLRQIIAGTALMIATVPAVTMPAMAQAQSSPKVTISHQGGYLADYQISYTVNGQRKEIKLVDLTLGYKRTMTLPTGSSQIRVRARLQTGLFWDQYREIFNQSAQNGSCFKTYGSVFNGQWSRDCTADF